MVDIDNILSKKIDASGEKSRFDRACKKLLSNKQVLARILKYCVKEFKDCDIKDIENKYIEGDPIISKYAVNPDEQTEYIQGINTEDVTIDEGTVYYDILFTVIFPGSGETVQMIINIEAQNVFNPGYPLTKRGIYYGGRMISRQYGTVFEKAHYEKLQKVYSIWICPSPPENRENTIVEYSITEKNIIGEVKEPTENYDLMTIMIICLGGKDDNNYSGIIKMLDVLLSGTIAPDEKKKLLKDEFDIAMTQEMESEAMDMCNLSQGIEDRAKAGDIIKIMSNMGVSEEKAMDILEIPDNYRSIYHDVINRVRRDMRLG